MSARVIERLIKKAWLQAIILLVITLVIVGIWRIRAMSFPIAAIKGPGVGTDVVQFNPKRFTYELFGSAGAGGTVNYTNITTSVPNQVEFSTLPWSHTETTLLTTASGSMMAQVDGDHVGCRILVNGVLRDEHVVSHDRAAVWCNVVSG